MAQSWPKEFDVAAKQKKTKTKVENLKRSRHTDEWLSWSLIDKMILAVHAAMEHSKKGEYKGPPKLGDCLASLDEFFEMEIGDVVDRIDMAEAIHQILDEYIDFAKTAALKNYTDDTQLKFIKKRFGSNSNLLPGKKYVNPQTKDIEYLDGNFRLSNLQFLVFTEGELQKIKSKRETKFLADKEKIYQRFVAASEGTLPSYRTLNEWRSPSFFGLKRPIDWNQIIEKYKKS